jgi:hypothetical protein
MMNLFVHHTLITQVGTFPFLKPVCTVLLLDNLLIFDSMRPVACDMDIDPALGFNPVLEM